MGRVGTTQAGPLRGAITGVAAALAQRLDFVARASEIAGRDPSRRSCW